MPINFTLLLCFCVLSLADGYTMHKSIITPFCDEGNLRLALNSATAYNTAFAWSKKADLNGWSFHRGVVNDTKIDCVRYSYSTHIRLPGKFSQYVGNLLRQIQIDKKACYVKNEYMEDVVVSGTSVVTDLHSTSQSRVHNNIMYTDIEVVYMLPWYVSFLEPLASKHIMHSFVEKYNILASNVCGETTQ